ncbi:response regulator transcription factor [Paenibacillus endoradicis]|uniref:response regulator transcription factor n=1 Tax=Paenibacillus endoradicis TaxID=2972487 RepID=UPI002158BE6A|nr:response regulator [Paenibacillus endoradicis]MCR8660091.1 response regulator [Paenibacillus endoradicis]
MKALIVDDESRVRKAIRLLVNWEEHGINEIKEADGGNKAIEMMSDYKPQIVIMDMMMDAGDGIALMTWIEKFSKTCKFIVISGHGDFEYMRNTVQCGGIDYILKPIDADIINSAVATAIKAWLAEENTRQIQFNQSIMLNQLKPVHDEKLLSGLINDTANINYTIQRLKKDLVIPNQITNAQLVILQINNADQPLLDRFGNDVDLLLYAIENICNECIGGNFNGVAFKYWGSFDQIILLLWDNKVNGAFITNKINNAIYIHFSRKFHFGTTTLVKFPTSLAKQYDEAISALDHRNLLDFASYLHDGSETRQFQNNVAYSFADVKEEWRVALLSGNQHLIQKYSISCIEKFMNNGYISPHLLHLWLDDMFSFRNSLLQEISNNQKNELLTMLEHQDTLNIPPNINDYSIKLHDWRQWVLQFNLNLSQAITSIQQNKSRSFSDIVSYIEIHYNEELTLQEIADTFLISREYISRKFKQEYAISFTEYVTSFRLNKAKSLLLNRNIKLNKIAEMVGIPDVKYFSKVFKKHEGLTPNEYRKTLSQ